MKRIDIKKEIMSIDTNKETFNLQDIENRRFMYNPKTGRLLLGVQFKGSEILFSHAEEYHRMGIREDFDLFVRGWVGAGGKYKSGIIHFAPNIPASIPEFFNKGFDTLEMFKRNNAQDNTIVRGFGQRWEQPLSDILIKNKEVDIMADRKNNYKKTSYDKPNELGLSKGQTEREQFLAITDKFEKGVKAVFESDKYKKYLSVMSKFHNYSFRNTLLIAMQNPNSSLVAGYSAWQRNFKRQVKKGEHGMKIVAPVPYTIPLEREKIDDNGNKVTEIVDCPAVSFRIATVFDVSQTEGEPLPQFTVDKIQGNVENYENMFNALENVSPVPIAFENITSGANGYFHTVEKRIAIQENMSELQTIKTMIHEIAHSKLHNFTIDELKQIPLEEQKNRYTKEVEAESIAFTVCTHYGLDTSDYTFGYIASWSTDKELPELQQSLETIQKTANEIISGIDEHIAELNQNKDRNISNNKDYQAPRKQTQEKPSVRTALKNAKSQVEQPRNNTPTKQKENMSL